MSTLADALAQFDRTEANLVKLEGVWEASARAIPDDVEFGLDGPEAAALFDRFDRLAASLPTIDGFTVTSRPERYDDIAETRFGYWEISEPLGRMKYDREVEAPGEEIAVYRQRMETARRRLVSSRVSELLADVDGILSETSVADGRGSWTGPDRWGDLEAAVSEIRRLCGAQVPGKARWSELARHLHFSAGNDLSDIVTMDWPSVRAEVEAWIFDGDDPIDVYVADPGALVATKPTGPVPTVVDWSRLDAEAFERLVFELIQSAEEYENATLLMKTNAPDRGRDIGAYRVVKDSLSGSSRSRLMVQCKHWQSKSITPNDLQHCLVSAQLWRDPPVDVVVVATSGRYSADAVAWAEARRARQEVPQLELWAENDLERMLSRRPHIAAEFDLR